MAIAAFAALAVALVIVICALLAVCARLAPSKPPVGKRLTVHTKLPDDQTLHGLLLEEHRDVVILIDASYVTATGDVPIPGRVRIPSGNVAWVQEHE